MRFDRRNINDRDEMNSGSAMDDVRVRSVRKRNTMSMIDDLQFGFSQLVQSSGESNRYRDSTIINKSYRYPKQEDYYLEE
jgi:hypothetical protein